MNPTQLAARLMWAAKELRSEALRWSGDRKDTLVHASRQASWAYRSAFSPNPEDVRAASALLDAAVKLLGDVIIARFERELANRETPTP